MRDYYVKRINSPWEFRVSRLGWKRRGRGRREIGCMLQENLGAFFFISSENRHGYHAGKDSVNHRGLFFAKLTAVKCVCQLSRLRGLFLAGRHWENGLSADLLPRVEGFEF